MNKGKDPPRVSAGNATQKQGKKVQVKKAEKGKNAEKGKKANKGKQVEKGKQGKKAAQGKKAEKAKGKKAAKGKQGMKAMKAMKTKRRPEVLNDLGSMRSWVWEPRAPRELGFAAQYCSACSQHRPDIGIVQCGACGDTN
jgi:hypothetical protein